MTAETTETEATATAPRLRLDTSLLAALGGNFLIRLDGGMVSSLMIFFLARVDERGIAAVPPITYGVLLSIFYLSELTFSPVMGAKSDQYGNRLVLLIAPIFGLVGVLIAGAAAFSEEFGVGLFTLFGVSSVLIALGLTRLLQGFAAAASIPAILSYLSARTEGSLALRGRVMSIFEVTTGIGLLLGPPLGTVLWRFAGAWGFIITGLAFLLSAAIFWLIRDSRGLAADPAAAAASEPTMRRMGRLLRRRDLLGFAPAWLAVNAVVGLWAGQFIYQMVNGSPTDDQFLTGRFGPGIVSAVQLGMGLLFSVGIVAWGFTFGRLREPTVMRISAIGLFGVCAAALLVNLFGESPSVLVSGIVLCAVSLLLMSGFAPAAVTYLARLAGRSVGDRGLLMGIYSVVLGLGQFVGYYFGGFFAQAGGVNGIILFSFLLGVLATFTVLRLDPVPADEADELHGRPSMGFHA